jgi:hypothetical protein
MPSGSQPSAVASHGALSRHTSRRIRLPSVDNRTDQVASDSSAVPLEVINEYSASSSFSCSGSCSFSFAAVLAVAVIPAPSCVWGEYTPHRSRRPPSKPGLPRLAVRVRSAVAAGSPPGPGSPRTVTLRRPRPRVHQTVAPDGGMLLLGVKRPPPMRGPAKHDRV